MNADKTKVREPNDAAHEVDLLAPWAATDRLDDADMAALEKLIADEPELGRRLEFALEERDETIALNEALPTPSTAAREKLFAAIDAHEAKRAPKSLGVMRWFSERISSLSPQTLAGGATAAALVIFAQAGIIGASYLGGDGGGATYQTASDGSGSQAAAGPTALVSFQPTATSADIEAALREAGAEVIGGPKPGGVFVIRVAGATTPEELEPSLKRLRDHAQVVKFAAPGGQ